MQWMHAVCPSFSDSSDRSDPTDPPAWKNERGLVCRGVIPNMKHTLLLLLSGLLLSTGLISAADTTGVPPTYPLKKCVVSDEDLGSMGKPVKVTHEGTDVYLCCKSCAKDFKKDPAKYVDMVKQAEAKKK